MAVMYEAAAYRARTTVEIFVRAPYGEVDIPIMETEWNVASCMGKVPANKDTFTLGTRGDCRYVEELTSVKLYAGEQN